MSAFAANGKVDLTVLPLGEHLTRWGVRNRLTVDQRAWLKAEVGEDLRPLFLGGHTRGGHGVGLATCTEFITNAFGLSTKAKALDGGYLGARLVDDHFLAWFHWPSYRPSAV